MPTIKKKKTQSKKAEPKLQEEKLLSPSRKRVILQVGKTVFWFSVGMVLGLFLLISVSFLLFEQFYKSSIYPGVYVNGVNFGGKSPNDLIRYFDNKNKQIQATTFTLVTDSDTATISAKDIHLGFDSVLLAQQAYSIGRSSDRLTNAGIVFQAYINSVSLSPAYLYSQNALNKKLSQIIAKNKIDPVDAVFTVQNGRVTTFRPSSNGQEIDTTRLQQDILAKLPYILASSEPQTFTIHVPLTIKKPKIATSDVNNLGITELIGTGTSLFQGSIPSRIYNVELASSRINGALIAPGDVFSFDQTVGDVSSLTGYKQAYVIQNGKTILGDGGGLCQVSTTLFRAALNAGLPIVERHAHAYRVEYYEEDGPPGIDATVYVPSVDLKFKNDTGHYILVQEAIDPSTLRLTFYLYGTSDGRTTTMTTPIVSNLTPPLPTIYTDDPTLPTGTLKQTDFAAGGATVSFSRTVMKDGKVYIADSYKSVYQPWAAAYLRGTGPAQ